MGSPSTIFAPATPPGRAAVAIVRISGPAAGPALMALTRRDLPRPRHASLSSLRDPRDGTLLDRALVLWFPGPASETGEDLAELQLHGGRAVSAGVVRVLGEMPELRLAEPGEFARRAYLAGKMDLTGVEGLADLVAAETGAQRRQALAQMGGALARRCEAWRSTLLDMMVRVEAGIDFPDEEVPEGVCAQDRERMRTLAGEIGTVLADGRRGERLRQGLSIAILGAPNAGKSSLLNRLARREAAIVASRPGTTRDVVEVHVDLGGVPAVLADTAGLRETADEVEREGVRRSLARAGQADLVVLVGDAGEADPFAPVSAEVPVLRVLNKCDLAEAWCGEADLRVSALTGEGIGDLELALASRAAALAGAGDALVTRERHRQALDSCRAALDRASAAPAAELVGEDLRAAAAALGRVTGRIDVEDVLDGIFAGFCIGK